MPQPNNITLSLTIEQLNIALQIMSKSPIPYEVTAPLIHEIQKQAQEQLNTQLNTKKESD